MENTLFDPLVGFTSHPVGEASPPLLSGRGYRHLCWIFGNGLNVSLRAATQIILTNAIFGSFIQ